MNSAELNVINSIIQDSKLMVVGDDLKNKVNRTLLYGYNTAHELFHVYLYQGFIYSVIERKIYFKPRNHRDFWLTMQEIKINTNDEYAQNAHLYSEHCDYEFCKLPGPTHDHSLR